MHLEEIMRQLDNEDTTNGMARFLIAKFPMVSNKIRPEIRPEGHVGELNDHMTDDIYFNDLTYDECVSCMAHVLLVSRLLFPYGEEREDSGTYPGSYSNILGVHTAPWRPSVRAAFTDRFNDIVDQVREDQNGTGSETSHLKKREG